MCNWFLKLILSYKLTNCFCQVFLQLAFEFLSHTVWRLCSLLKLSLPQMYFTLLTPSMKLIRAWILGNCMFYSKKGPVTPIFFAQAVRWWIYLSAWANLLTGTQLNVALGYANKEKNENLVLKVNKTILSNNKDQCKLVCCSMYCVNCT